MNKTENYLKKRSKRSKWSEEVRVGKGEAAQCPIRKEMQRENILSQKERWECFVLSLERTIDTLICACTIPYLGLHRGCSEILT